MLGHSGEGGYRAEPPEERRDEGDKPADRITTVPFSLSLCLPKVGDYYLCEQGGWWESIFRSSARQDKGQVMRGNTNSALNVNGRGII